MYEAWHTKGKEVRDENGLLVVTAKSRADARRIVAALDSSRLLCVAYDNGEKNGGSIDWDDVGLAYQHAREAMR